ncbi:MAG: hypothetical protein LBT88_01500 [Oscillospiraceae bacterium]|jgi:hypothetical protein|nr:hypothetical protein [Oscillospiraceae bacterium]
MPIINASFSDPDTADRALARLRQAGIPFNASYQYGSLPKLPGGYVAHVAYPNATSFAPYSNQVQPAMLVATASLPQPTFSRETTVSFRVNHSVLSQATNILHNSGAYSLTQ